MNSHSHAWLSGLPKPLYAAQLIIPESFLLTFVKVPTFPSCRTPVFPLLTALILFGPVDVWL